MVRLSPPERIGEFFGIYGLVGKGSQVIGQLLYGAIIFLLLDRLGNGAYQVAVLSLLVTMLIGLWLVWPVSDAGRARARSSRSGRRRQRRRRRAWRPTGRRSRTALGAVSRRSRPGGPAARPRPSRSSPRASSGAASSPGPRAARAFDATRTGGSPGATRPTVCGIGRPTTRSAAAHDLADREARPTCRGCR